MQIDWIKIKRWALEDISEQDRQEVEIWGKAADDNREFLENVKRYYDEGFLTFSFRTEKRQAWKKINPGRSVGIRKRYWVYTVAASVLLFVSIGIGKFLLQKNESERLDFRQGEVQLRLANGEKYQLTSLGTADSLPAGFKINDKGLQQVKGCEKKIPSENFNEITVPRCAEYRLILADGTQVFLNAESTLRFPESFGQERRVSLTGEAYFEVARDTIRPFRVETGNITVQVLGTQFNVRKYEGESYYTTLVSGAVKVIKNDRECILKPGQQCEISETEKWFIREPDLMTVLAWKKGEFVFKDVALETIMEELVRWYNIQVEYESEELRNLRFFLYLDRSEKPEDIMDKIKLTNKIDYRTDGRKIIIEKR